MRSERLWVLLLVATTFCAGIAAGVLIAMRVYAAREKQPFGAYEAQMVAAFDLSERQQGYLHYILQDYRSKIEALKERNIAALDDEFVKIGLDHRELIREKVIPAHQRQQFDQWVSGQPVLSGAKVE